MKIAPHSIEAEQMVLGFCLLNPEAVHVAVANLIPDDFYDNRHITIFSEILKLHNSGRNVDLVLVANEIGEDGLKTIGAYLGQLADVIPMPSATIDHCRTIKDKSIARRVIEVAMMAQDACYRGDSSKLILEKLSDGLLNLVGKDRGKPETLAQITPRVMTRIENTSLYGKPYGLPTGFTDIDRRLSGLSKKDLIIIAARPAMGKTVFAVDIALNVAGQGVPVLMFSLEMSKEQIVTRAISRCSNVSGGSIREGSLNEMTWPRVNTARKFLDALPMTIIDDPGLSINEIRSYAKTQHMRNRLGLIVVDYMQLSKAKAQSREREVSEISAGLKGIAKELDLPVIALSQLNRSLEARSDKRPTLADLRESGSIEQDADVVLMIYRDEVYNPAPGNPRKGIAEIITAKQRNGPTGRDELCFQGEFSRFLDYQREYEAGR